MNHCFSEKCKESCPPYDWSGGRTCDEIIPDYKSTSDCYYKNKCDHTPLGTCWKNTTNSCRNLYIYLPPNTRKARSQHDSCKMFEQKSGTDDCFDNCYDKTLKYINMTHAECKDVNHLLDQMGLCVKHHQCHKSYADKIDACKVGLCGKESNKWEWEAIMGLVTGILVIIVILTYILCGLGKQEKMRRILNK